MTLSLPTPVLPNFALSPPTADRQESHKRFHIQKYMLLQVDVRNANAKISGQKRILLPTKDCPLCLSPGPHGAQGARIKVSAKFARNPLKRLISDERIQGNPNFSNPV
jgi:hypothetical protein